MVALLNSNPLDDPRDMDTKNSTPSAEELVEQTKHMIDELKKRREELKKTIAHMNE